MSNSCSHKAITVKDFEKRGVLEPLKIKKKLKKKCKPARSVFKSGSCCQWKLNPILSVVFKILREVFEMFHVHFPFFCGGGGGNRLSRISDFVFHANVSMYCTLYQLHHFRVHCNTVKIAGLLFLFPSHWDWRSSVFHSGDCTIGFT